jgi:hypothetical protein
MTAVLTPIYAHAEELVSEGAADRSKDRVRAAFRKCLGVDGSDACGRSRPT